MEILNNALQLQNLVTEISLIDEMLAVVFKRPESYTKDGET